MRRKLILGILAWVVSLTALAQVRHFTAHDGLPTGEVQQIVELPNGQLIVNCEGVFCITNGAGFDALACDYGSTYQLPAYTDSYGQMWQGDSLLWLRDFYRIYLFDVRRRSFRYDIEPRLEDSSLKAFVEGRCGHVTPNEQQWLLIDSLRLGLNVTCAVNDRQNGLWIGLRTDGIVYLPPRRTLVQQLTHGHWLVGLARSTTDSYGAVWRCRGDGVERELQGASTLYNKSNVTGLPYNRTTFIQQLHDGRYLLCDSLSTLGYFSPEARRFVSLNDKLPALQTYRHFVGACPVDNQWTVVYAQNGILMLDTKADTLAPFPPATEIARYATKYNCMLCDREGLLWIGTQNGLFVVHQAMIHKQHPQEGICRSALPLRSSKNPRQTEFESPVRRIAGLRNNCIRSLILDGKGRVWAGTSCGISRITPAVVNLGSEDGIPASSMMERAACLAADGQLVFAMGGSQALKFSPDSVINEDRPLPVVITAFRVNDRDMGMEETLLPYNQNNLTFRFSTLDYAAPSHSVYRYRLYPLEEEWNVSNDGSGQAAAHYIALSPGTYQFQVQASTPDGGWGEATTTAIVIRPPMWLTWWAKAIYVLLCLLVGALLIHLYIKKRKKQLERKNEERVNRLFELRDEARHQFAQSVNIVPEIISTNKEEEALVEKLLKAIEQNMDNADYTVDQMASDIAISRASLYKKTQQMLGITPNEFLRNVRLKHAARLLAETNEPVNQISLKVGFQTSRYFSQCFRQMFGMTPTEYRTGNPQ